MTSTGNPRIGIIGGGLQGKSIGLWFAKREFYTDIYEINQDRLNRLHHEVFPDNRKYGYIKKYLHITNHVNELKDCQLFIENIPENLQLKQTVFKYLESIAQARAIFSSNSSTFTPTELSAPLKNRQNFINMHFLGIPWGGRKVELIPGQHTSEATIEFAKDILVQANLMPVKIAECPGFVYNRIKLAEVSNLFKAIERGMVSLACGLRYNIFSRLFYPLAFIDFMGIDSSESAIRSLNRVYGDRFYPSKLLAEKVKQNKLGVKTGEGFLDHSQPVSLDSLGPDFSKSRSPIQAIFVEEAQVNHSNLIIQMIRKGKKIFFDHEDNAYFSLLKKIEPNLYSKIKNSSYFMNQIQNPPAFDLILLSARVTFAHLVDRIRNIQQRFGTEIPVVINSPIYKIEEIAANTLKPALVFGINCQKNFLENTELVRAKSGEEKTYEQLKIFIGELTGDCLEVEDDFCRPLIFALIPKMFEAARLIEEGIADKEKIELALDRDSVIKDMDYFGLDYLVTVANYLRPIYGQPFIIPGLIEQMVAKGYLGVSSGQGFYPYF